MVGHAREVIGGILPLWMAGLLIISATVLAMSLRVTFGLVGVCTVLKTAGGRTVGVGNRLGSCKIQRAASKRVSRVYGSKG